MVVTGRTRNAVGAQAPREFESPPLRMEKIYEKILELVRPYYEKGRVYDLGQIDWMMK